MSGILQYSVGTEDTGRVLAEALGYQTCKKAPSFSDYSVYIGWGSRRPKGWDRSLVDTLVQDGRLRVLNHPAEIFANRDKVSMLERLQAADVSVPGFVARDKDDTVSRFRTRAVAAIASGVIAYPILGMTRKNRGVPAFCFVAEDLTSALAAAETEGTAIEYLRSLSLGLEYRVHVLRDKMILAQKKVPDKNPLEACVSDLTAKLKFLMEKESKIAAPPNGVVDWIVRQLAPEMLQGANHVQKSLKRGWVLRDTGIDRLPRPVADTAVRALDAAGLDLGAVSISYSEDRARVTNITTGPGLEEQHIPLYVSAIEEFAGREVTEKSAEEKKKTRFPKGKKLASAEMIARIAQSLSGMTEEEAHRFLKIKE